MKSKRCKEVRYRVPPAFDLAVLGETDKASAAWSLYRDMAAPRRVDLSDTEAGAAISVRRATWAEWARRFAWRERAAEWDAEVDRNVLDRTVDTRTQSLEAARELDRMVLDLLTARVRTIQPEDLTPALLPRYMQAYARFRQAVEASSATEAQRDAVEHFADTWAAAEARHRCTDDDSTVH